MIISGLVLVPGIYSLIRWGVKPAIDFTGGTLVEIKSDKNIPGGQKTSTGTYILRFAKDDEKIPATGTAEIIRNETVGPILGAELLKKTVTAAIIAIAAILLYVAYAFKNFKFGISAVIALIHDLLVVVGCFSLLGHFLGVEVDTLFVTAILTTMSFSVHDTIVVFDRIREKLKRGDRLRFEELCDQALTETIGRSAANSFTIVFMLLALALLGGETIRWFVIALLIGTVSGTYSSPFVATPILILWNRWEKRKLKDKN
jgi:preprotein translocase subunit SecF